MLDMTDENKPLTRKEEHFSHEYQIDWNGAGAARRAGYSEKTARITGSKLLAKPNVQKRIAELSKARMKEADVSATGVALMLLDSYRGAMKAKQFGPAVRAAELLGKRLAMFVDRQIADPHPALSPELIARAIAGGNDILYAQVIKLIPRPPTLDGEARLVSLGPESEPVTGFYSGGRPH